MSISSALQNAITGLRAAGRATEVVSSNLSNALTPGYGVRSLELSSMSTGGMGGVRIEGIVRHGDSVLTSERQLASSAFSNHQTNVKYMEKLEALVGTPDQAGSLTQQIAAFESSLITASSRPDEPDRLLNAVNAAKDLTNTINTISDGIQEQRSRADHEIETQVTKLNNALSVLQKVNNQVISAARKGIDHAGLLDQRQKLVDQISEIVPVKIAQRDHGSIALYTPGGSILLDGKAAEISFSSVNLVTSELSIEEGELSGLQVNGMPVSTDSERGALRGGSLGALFNIRDELAPNAQSQLDAVTRDLIERFDALAPTDANGASLPGLFTDNGAGFDASTEKGISGRIQLNNLVNPEEGGEVWRLRDGLNAAEPGVVGDASLLQEYTNALGANRQPLSGDFGSRAFSAVGLSSSMMSLFAVERLNNEQHLSFATAQLNELSQQELAGGVDSDTEMQNLILIEQAYAANARVIQTVDGLLDTLLRI